MTCPTRAFFKVGKAEPGGPAVIAELVHRTPGSTSLNGPRVAQGELSLKGGSCSQSFISDLMVRNLSGGESAIPEATEDMELGNLVMIG